MLAHTWILAFSILRLTCYSALRLSSLLRFPRVLGVGEDYLLHRKNRCVKSRYFAKIRKPYSEGP
ncbi:hypothetical protein ABO04_00975 [Nitrosomonas sp. HPC101]|nr:hypothetical protein [Nitrosomonas sp. HPC101]